MSIRRLLAGLALGTAASVIASAPAGAGPTGTYPPQLGGLTVSATSLVAGSTLTLSGSGFAPGCAVTITVMVEGLGVTRTFTADADASGVLSTSLTLSTVGTNTITAACADPNGAPLILSATVSVTAAPPASAGGLPNTGSNVLSPLVLGGVLVLGGAGVIVAARRRRRRGSAPSTG